MAGQRFLVIEHRAEIAHIKLSAARVAFPEMLGFAQRRAASLLAVDFAARDRRRHARVRCHVLPSLDLIGISVFEP